VGMGAGMKIGQKKYSERMRPSRPTIDYEPQSANQMRTRPSNPLKATFSAELVSKGWPRNGADQTIPQNLPEHISIQAVIPIRQRFGRAGCAGCAATTTDLIILPARETFSGWPHRLPGELSINVRSALARQGGL